MIDELRQIAIFAKTIEHGSFRATAQALRLSPSVVSHHVAQLEQRLGTALLYRTTRKLSLTPDGERLLHAAQAMIEAAEAGIQDITNKTEQTDRGLAPYCASYYGNLPYYRSVCSLRADLS